MGEVRELKTTSPPVEVAIRDWSPSPKVMEIGVVNVVVFLVATGLALRLETALVPTAFFDRICTV
jgi:hypothetical protein